MFADCYQERTGEEELSAVIRDAWQPIFATYIVRLAFPMHGPRALVPARTGGGWQPFTLTQLIQAIGQDKGDVKTDEKGQRYFDTNHYALYLCPTATLPLATYSDSVYQFVRRARVA